MTAEDIFKMSKYRFRKMVDKKVNRFVFQNLKEKASPSTPNL